MSNCSNRNYVNVISLTQNNLIILFMQVQIYFISIVYLFNYKTQNLKQNINTQIKQIRQLFSLKPLTQIHVAIHLVECLIVSLLILLILLILLTGLSLLLLYIIRRSSNILWLENLNQSVNIMFVIYKSSKNALVLMSFSLQSFPQFRILENAFISNHFINFFDYFLLLSSLEFLLLSNNANSLITYAFDQSIFYSMYSLYLSINYLSSSQAYNDSTTEKDVE
ncbi:transmembrane protein, putative (macronuclear) [Tetrahymena thermophila SB210]|uniref:Transmembrane protein, putative n=1 Tax=Tetrahymena thermophila (strain SB210) TaxID=312017 RepID=W7XCC5_TETTS|nr:transmembrane protein, putative [Tetrahymena thermophila SB210]EWS71391.1 transmembrane protein, putative [Tetrahymena thermophila SB210]|eukprot:XP_012656063.1 transmembrane protein, putative [Tetrahymena thermophila SB210]